MRQAELLPIRRATQPATGPRIVEMPPLSFRADVQAQSANEADRTVELIFTTGAPVDRYDWMSDTRYVEVLSLDPAHVRLDRLNQGAPLLDSHSAWSVADMLGAVVPGSATLSKKEGRVTVRFSKRDAVEPVWRDVLDGLIRSVSVGYRVYRFEEVEGKGNKLPVRTAIDWEPYEVSMVPMPADPGAHVREGRSENANQCEIVVPAAPAPLKTRAASPKPEAIKPVKPETGAKPEERTMEPSEYIDERVNEEPAVKPPAPTEPNERDLGAAAERARCQGIMLACRAARLPQAFADKLIADNIPLVEAQARVFAEMNIRTRDGEGPGRIPDGGPGVTIVGDDPLVHKRDGIRNALLHRVAPEMRDSAGKQKFPLDDNGRQYRGLSLIDTARLFLHGRGVRTSHMSKMDVLSAALGSGSVFIHNERLDSAMDVRGGMHTTSDFALLLADVQGKVLRAAYGEAPQTWAPIARTVTLSDFKASKQMQLGEAPGLLEVLEHGEFTRGTIAEGKEQFQLATYGRIFAITRQALMNDDLAAFSRVASEFGRQARRKESDLAWAQITANGNMGDAHALFDATYHTNYTASGTVISVDNLGIGRAALRKQTGLDGATLLNLSARFLIVPAAKETIADQYTSANYVPSAAGSVNPFAGRLQVIAEPRLDVASATAWYLSAGIDEIDILLHGVLEGQEGPAVETRVGFDVDGLEIKCRLDCAFKVADWRGLYKNVGA
jgi:phage major head subunit gpT-like protein